MRLSLRVGVLCAVGMAAACTLVNPSSQEPAAKTVERPDPALAAIANQLQIMAKLSQGTPTEQAELFAELKDAAQLTPTTQNRLGYALALATPGHGASDAEAARQQLSALLAAPQTMLPSEFALTQMV